MIKLVPILGALVLVALLSLVLAGAPPDEVSAAGSVALSDGCTIQETALDQGYGISRTVMRRVCAPQ